MLGLEFGEGFVKMVEARWGRRVAGWLLAAIVVAVFLMVALLAVTLFAAIAKFVDYISPVFVDITIPSYLTLSSISAVALALIVVVSSFVILRLVRKTAVVSQSALNELGRLRDIGINTLYANPPANVQDVSRWISDHDSWESDVKRHLAATFPPADLSRFTNLGVIIAIQFAPGMIVDHRHENKMRSLAKQLNTLEEFLASYRGR